MTSSQQSAPSPATLVWNRSTENACQLDRLGYAFLSAFVFAIPWEEAFPLFGGFGIARWLGLLALGAVVARTFLTGQVRLPAGVHYWMMALAAWGTSSLLWTVDWDSTISRVGTYSQLLIAVWLIWELAPTNSRVFGLFVAYIAGAFISSVFVIGNWVQGLTMAQLAAASGKDIWDTSRYSVGGVNENDAGLMLALSIPMAMYVLASRRGARVTMFCWVHLVSCATAMLLTGSRGTLVAAIPAVAMLPLTISRLSGFRRIAVLIACAGTAACGLYLVPQSSWDRLLSVWTELTQGTLTHRTLIWAAGIQVFRDHPILGVGAGSYGVTVLRALDVPYVAHNTYLSVLVELGVLGELILIGTVAALFYRIAHMQRLERWFWILLMLTWMVGVSVLTWDYRKPTWLLFGLMAAHAGVPRNAVGRTI